MATSGAEADSAEAEFFNSGKGQRSVRFLQMTNILLYTVLNLFGLIMICETDVSILYASNRPTRSTRLIFPAQEMTLDRKPHKQC